MKPWFLIIVVIVLSACGTPQVSTPAPTPQAINLIYPPSLQPWADRLSACANNDPLVALYTFPATHPGTTILPDQIFLELSPSDSEIKTASLYQVGQEQIVVVINQANSLASLSSDELRSLFSGQQKTWPEKPDLPVQVWVLPKGDPVRTIFDNVVMQTFPLTTDAMLAPDPSAMLEGVSENANAIGYLPTSYLKSSSTVDPSKVNIVSLDSSLQANLNKPVVAATSGEPQGLLRNLLVCLQSSTP